MACWQWCCRTALPDQLRLRHPGPRTCQRRSILAMAAVSTHLVPRIGALPAAVTEDVMEVEPFG
jgi:hypothetical protein